MCVVTYIGVYNTYLKGKCFLSALYNDIICATPPQSKLLFVSNISWHSTPVLANCSTRIDFSLEQIIKQIRQGEIIVHENFVAQSLNSSNKLQHRSVRCCDLSCGMLPLFAYIHAHIVGVAQRVAKFVNFDTKSFMFLWNILLKDYSSEPFWTYNFQQYLQKVTSTFL